jgi:hypothetical protein
VATDLLFPGARINVIDPMGNPRTVAPEEFEEAMRRGYRMADAATVNDRLLERQYGDSPIQAGIEGAARGLTFGASDLLLPALGADKEGLRERRARNEVASTIGEVGGMVAPALLTGGGGLAGSAGKAAAGAAERALTREGAGLLGRAAARAGTSAARMGTEGAVYGVGQGISDVALSKDPMSAEAIIGDLGHHILVGAGFGAVGGAGLSVAGSALGVAADKAGKAIQRATSKLQAELEAGTEGMLSTTDDALRVEVMGMSRPALEAAAKAETEALTAARRVEGKALAKDLEGFYLEQRNELFKLRQQLPDKALKRDAIQATEGFKRILGDLESLAEEPITALKPLRRLEQQLGVMAKYLPDGSMKPALDRVAALKDRVVDLSGDVASPRLEAVTERMAMLDRPPPKTPMLDAAAQSLGASAGGALGKLTGIPYAGMAGAFLGREFSEVLKPLMRRVLGSFVGHAGGIEDGVTKFLTRLGTPESALGAVERLAGASTVAAGDAYERATRAVTDANANLQQTDGHLTQQLAGLAQVAPQTAAQVKQGMLAKIQFLASKVPPQIGGAFGFLPPSDTERYTFARYAAAAEDPLRLVKELRAGMVMPETVETAQALYPVHLEKIKAALAEQLADPVVRARVPYQMRLEIGMILGPQVDPTLDPSFIALMQEPTVPSVKPPSGGGSSAPTDVTSAQRLTAGGLR